MAFVKVAKVSDVLEGEMAVVKVKGKNIMLAKVDGQVFAMEEECTHEGGPLHEGILEGYTVTCPWHEGKYDVRDGKADPETDWVHDTNSWKVKIDGDDILIDL